MTTSPAAYFYLVLRLSAAAGPNLRAIMINVNAPETRGVALALQSVTDDLGKGLGPVIVAGVLLCARPFQEAMSHLQDSSLTITMP